MEHIHIKDSALLQKKIQKIKQEGKEKFHVVSDFDRTLTYNTQNGEVSPTSFALLSNDTCLGSEYKKKDEELLKIYYPIEKDDSMDLATKSKYMHEWWTKHEQVVVDMGLQESMLTNLLASYPKFLREETHHFFEQLSNKDIPLLIFSAGIGNIIEGYLKDKELLTPNVHILANIFGFDKNGYATGYQSEIIHTFNKSEEKITCPEYLDIINQRTNVLLLGDSIGDVTMVADQNKTVIRIGFLNEHKKDKIDMYQNAYDVVITDDGSFSYVNNLLAQLV